MAKLYFRYGVVSSAKTLNLLATLHNYESQGKRALLIKPALDTRTEMVESRAGLSHKADITLSHSDNPHSFIYPHLNDDIAAILVDEVQFLTSQQIEYLRRLTVVNDIPVLCYGLRTKSDATLWPSIVTLMALADSIEEVKTTCTYCNRKAIFSKLVNSEGLSDTGIKMSWDSFIPVCARHYYNK